LFVTHYYDAFRRSYYNAETDRLDSVLVQNKKKKERHEKEFFPLIVCLIKHP